ncbi:MAG TPA: glycosyltransferase family 4 protein [Syntrophales bacterium]|nr:glycosyltransferase family 4 protein [Syntrophales bacterium]HOL59247.1 glycosyltransferase family 4 protein [Syntrophales bacterium]HPO35297.1 glycosyltransferase family 4 protein [Syntrophales bacterium]
MQLKILFVIDGLEFGGGERVFSQIIRGLAPESYDIHAASFPEGAFRFSLPAHVTFHAVDFSRRTDFRLFLQLYSIIKDHGIEIVHGQGGRAEFFARIAARLGGAKAYISTIAMPVEGYDVPSAKRILYEILDRTTERLVTRFLVCSSALERVLIEDHGIEESRITKIYNGIEWQEYDPHLLGEERSEIRTKLGLASEVPLVGAIGRLVWQKGFIFFLKAIPNIFHAVPQARFVLVGDGPLRAILEEEAKRLKILERTTFVGYTKEAKKFLAAMDVVVIPSLREGFPMVTLEAMALEKPIVATEIDGITEQIHSGKEGILVPPQSPESLARAVIYLLQERAYAEQLGKAARKKVRAQFSVEKMIGETTKVYEELTAQFHRGEVT